MVNMKKIVRMTRSFLFEPRIRFQYLARLGFYDGLSDEEYIKKKYKIIMNKPLDVDNPQTFNEKLQWLKLHNRKPEYTMLVDKYGVRQYIEKKLGKEYLIPLLGVWDNAEDIEFDNLPEQFVLKCNHNSGKGMCICKDKSKLDSGKVKKALGKGIKENYYLLGREWPYKNVSRKIIGEKFMTDGEQDGLTDYKFFCFNGVVDCVMVCTERNTGHPKYYFFDRDWKLLRYNVRGKEAAVDFTLPKPSGVEKMFEIAAVLSDSFPFVRVDLYSCNDQIYFGEMTFYPDSGFDPNILEEVDKHWGDMIDLSLVKEG